MNAAQGVKPELISSFGAIADQAIGWPMMDHDDEKLFGM